MGNGTLMTRIKLIDADIRANPLYQRHLRSIAFF
jgi:hypothetical protein